MSFVHVTFQTNGVLLLFSCYTWKLREWFTLLFALLVIPILAHTCWVRPFLCLSQERTIHYTIVLIPTVFLPYALVSSCYLVMIFFIHIIREKFEFTSHAHSWSFANIYQEKIELKWKIYMIRPFLNKNLHEFLIFYIRPCSAVDSAQWDLSITTDHCVAYLSQTGLICDVTMGITSNFVTHCDVMEHKGSAHRVISTKRSVHRGNLHQISRTWRSHGNKP